MHLQGTCLLLYKGSKMPWFVISNDKNLHNFLNILLIFPYSANTLIVIHSPTTRLSFTTRFDLADIV